MEIAQLLDQMQTDGTLHRISADPLVQFGTDTRRYIGAEILPERNVTVNAFRETKIGFRTLVANHGSRYSPAQRKGGKYVGHFDVVLADSDIADEFTGAEYDALLDMITPITGPIDATVQGMAALAQIARWIDKGINLPLVETNEVMRWQALVGKKVTLRGDNGYKEDIKYPAYPDLSFASVDWSDPAVDPYDDFAKIMAAMALRGTTIRRIITSSQVVALLQRNPKISTRAGRITVTTAGQIETSGGIVTLSQINAALSQDGLPPIEKYDLQYRTSTGQNYFLPRNVMVFIGTSDSEEVLDLSDSQFETIEGTLGYVAVGRGVGRATPGRYIRMESFDNKPPRVDAEGWQTSLPVITEPELVGVVSGIPIP